MLSAGHKSQEIKREGSILSPGVGSLSSPGSCITSFSQGLSSCFHGQPEVEEVKDRGHSEVCQHQLIIKLLTSCPSIVLSLQH